MLYLHLAVVVDCIVSCVDPNAVTSSLGLIVDFGSKVDTSSPSGRGVIDANSLDE